MKTLPTLYFCGQLMEIVGAYLLFRYGTPKHILTNSVWGNTGDKEARPKREAENKRYRQLTRVGFACILLGFILQFPISISNCFNN
jgi:hypothetical protein